MSNRMVLVSHQELSYDESVPKAVFATQEQADSWIKQWSYDESIRGQWHTTDIDVNPSGWVY